MPENSVVITNLAQFRSAVRAAWGRAPQAIADALVEGGQLIIRRAGEGAPSQFGPSLFLEASKDTIEIRSSLEWGAGAEWGRFGNWQGFVRRWGTQPRFVWPAMEAEHDRIVELILGRINDITTMYGWAA